VTDLPPLPITIVYLDIDGSTQTFVSDNNHVTRSGVGVQLFIEPETYVFQPWSRVLRITTIGEPF
jgi:hypothetical protein